MFPLKHLRTSLCDMFETFRKRRSVRCLSLTQNETRDGSRMIFGEKYSSEVVEMWTQKSFKDRNYFAFIFLSFSFDFFLLLSFMCTNKNLLLSIRSLTEFPICFIYQLFSASRAFPFLLSVSMEIVRHSNWLYGDVTNEFPLGMAVGKQISMEILMRNFLISAPMLL